ncbi:hypothetical protein L6L59_20725 [Escherichia coli]|uniref:Uncharacterized protein n=1 Tax=Escherichia coli TaxID=562 RepID=A0AAW7V415_ECOLX|nr:MULTISPECIES: hypothetical protein [Enterobacteriaceae]USJ84406.1 hypothetical protein LXH19_19175 [Shigella sp. PIB]MCD5357176.1 hypothetical protein [Escherichia coli]MCD6881255.1 hypothetical protein [Escherichia coli]MCD6998206.1 hypothetical protein [Escherichia coli]MCD9159708.1 hypothetical protein [Escherichia coli]
MAAANAGPAGVTADE